MFRQFKKKRLAITTIVYWFLLCYIVAALAWWYIELWHLNDNIFLTRKSTLIPGGPVYQQQLDMLLKERARKNAQFISEGITFLAVTILAAIFVYRSVKKQILLNNQQQNFMMAVTHELKTPIAVTKLNLETLKRHKLDAARVEKIIDNSLQETNRLNDLCNNILLSSQLETGSFQLSTEIVPIDKLALQAVEQFLQRFPKRIIQHEISNSVNVSGDALMLRLSINNLLENALKYSAAEEPVRIRLFTKAKKAVVEVSDTGDGIPDTEKKKIFDKFYRIGDENRRNTKGTGLGLFLTKKIVEDHGGLISIRDNHPRGTVFNIELPKSEE